MRHMWHWRGRIPRSDRWQGELQVHAMIAGVEKGGTTWLGNCLGHHPRILYGPAPSQPDLEFNAFVDRIADDPLRFRREFMRVFNRRPRSGDVVVGKSVDILHVPRVANAVHRHNPFCRILVILRDPVDRAYSSYWYQLYRGKETSATFEEAIRREEDLKSRDGALCHLAYLEKGKYVEHLERLITVFGEDQVHVLLLEDLRSDRQNALNDVARFLGLAPVSWPDSPAKNRAKVNRWQLLARAVHGESWVKMLIRRVTSKELRRNVLWWLRRANAVERSPPPMNAETRAELTDFFRPYNERLEAFLGRRLEDWGV